MPNKKDKKKTAPSRQVMSSQGLKEASGKNPDDFETRELDLKARNPKR